MSPRTRTAISHCYQPANLSPGPGGGGAPPSAAWRSDSFRPACWSWEKTTTSTPSPGRVELLLAHPVQIQSFYLGATEVSNSQYQAFLSEHPDWSFENRAALMEKGLVTEDYLSSWPNGRIPAGQGDLPVTTVSWYAAAAYCEWLSLRVQSAMPGYIARLPAESEWEWAARGGLRGKLYPLGDRPGSAVFFRKGMGGPAHGGSSDPNAYGLRDMLGNVWEWCADPFSITAEMLSALDPTRSEALEKLIPDGPDRVVRGGSWASQEGTEKVYTRGSQPASWCTPYLGFRVAIARK